MSQSPDSKRVETSPPPPYWANLPDHFTVGQQQTWPLVGTGELLDHLVLLGAFSNMKMAVVTMNEAGLCELPLDKDEAWTVFLCRAVYRFERWVMSSSTPLANGALPPLDVLMVWHSYMLNPMTYYEDGARVLPQLPKLGSFPLSPVARSIDASNLQYNVPARMRENFEIATGESYDPPLYTSVDDFVFISCPCCEAPGEKYHWPWINAKGTGWAQRCFRATCPVCKQSFDHEAYGARKFCDEVIKWRMLRDETPYWAPWFFFAGLLKRLRNEAAVGRIMQIFLGSPPIANEIRATTGASLARSFNWKLSNIARWASRQPFRHVRLVQRVLMHYAFPGPFSIELTGAVMRQAGFIEKMRGIGWTRLEQFHNDYSQITRGVARYHAFLDLMATNPSLFAVPTLDIDLAWHTHQLKGKAYHTETAMLVGRSPDHDDKVEEGALSNAFENTARAWMNRFGVPYSLCGCVAPSESGLSETVRRMAALIPGTAEHKRRASSAPPIPHNERPDLISTEEGDSDATHPSDHNAVVFAGLGSAPRKTREQIRDELLQQRGRDVERGRAGPWSTLQHCRGQQRASSHDSNPRTFEHKPAFFRPVSFWGVSPYPRGNYGFGGSACGDTDGGVISSCSGSTDGSSKVRSFQQVVIPGSLEWKMYDISHSERLHETRSIVYAHAVINVIPAVVVQPDVRFIGVLAYRNINTKRGAHQQGL
ncbi:hypothetical protein AURDEDRAFT_162726 [Auricularia subglabra TFB-10046 SS5]|nr:hypothetical protein AURDEDRAFT_162726 [Auricularia subglabra TFB-10046 SS5]